MELLQRTLPMIGDVDYTAALEVQRRLDIYNRQCYKFLHFSGCAKWSICWEDTFLDKLTM